MRPVLYVVGLVGAVAVVVVVDRSPSDIANQATLLILMVAAGLLGFVSPRWSWMAGLVLGGSIAGAHALYRIFDVAPPYPSEPSGWAGEVTLLALHSSDRRRLRGCSPPSEGLVGTVGLKRRHRGSGTHRK